MSDVRLSSAIGATEAAGKDLEMAAQNMLMCVSSMERGGEGKRYGNICLRQRNWADETQQPGLRFPAVGYEVDTGLLGKEGHGKGGDET